VIKLNKTLSLVAAAAAFVLTQTAFAQDAAPKARAEVKAETKKAKADGAMGGNTEGSAATPAAKSATTRAEVKAETKAAKAEGKMAAPTEVGSPASAPRKQPSEKTRAEVKADTAKAMKDGSLSKGNAEK